MGLPEIAIIGACILFGFSSNNLGARLFDCEGYFSKIAGVFVIDVIEVIA